MSDAVNIALNGLNNASTAIAKATSSIVNASSTGASGDLTTNVVELLKQKNNYEADAKAIRVAENTTQFLLDIIV